MQQRAIELHPEAISEAQTARQWYAERSPIAADAFIAELDLAIESIGDAPER